LKIAIDKVLCILYALSMNELQVLPHSRKERFLMVKREKAQGLTVSELADRLGVHRNTVIYWIKTGQLKARRAGISRNSPYTIAMDEVERVERELADSSA
jgi:excisionase family DNA binding protein